MNLTNLNKDRKNRIKPTLDLSNMVYGKVPPQAKELEEAILGACMLDRNCFDVVSEILKAESFYVDAHQRVFRSFCRLSERMVICDILTVVEDLKKSEELDMVGGPYGITKMTNAVVSTANIEEHIRIVQQKYLQRELIRISGETIGLAYEDSTDAFDLLDAHETQIFAISNNIIKSDFKTSDTLATQAMERVDFLLNNKDQLSGVPTGFALLDKKTNGWQETDLIILAARPSVGKTAFALNLARNAASDKLKPTPVGFFSLEMSSAQLTERILSAESKVHLEKIKRGRLYGNDYDEVLMSSGRFGEMPILIDDTAALNLFEFRAKARRMVNKHKVGLIIIDYLQLMSGTGNGNREQEVSHISRGLKSLAKQLKVPIIALSQMSRDIEKRKGEPMLSDLRESGAIEQDADIVMFLYRTDYQQEADKVDPMIAGDAFLKTAKHRNGSLFTMPFKTDLTIQTWYDVEEFEKINSIFLTTGGNWKMINKDDNKEGMPF